MPNSEPGNYELQYAPGGSVAATWRRAERLFHKHDQIFNSLDAVRQHGVNGRNSGRRPATASVRYNDIEPSRSACRGEKPGPD
jgi:hypothetical protein